MQVNLLSKTILGLILSVTSANATFLYLSSNGLSNDVGGLSLGLTANPQNAAFNNDAFWYFTHNTNVLNRATLSYAGSGTSAVPSVSSLASFPVLGMTPTGVDTNTFGDIAIDGNTDTLYASTERGRFYSLDLNNPVLTFNEIVASPGNDTTVGLELSFNANSSVLYGHNYATGNWYTIDTGTGATTQIAGFVTNGFVDIAGANGDLLYGMGDDTTLYAIDIANKTTQALVTTTDISNGIGLAYDAAREQTLLAQVDSFTVPEPSNYALIAALSSVALLTRRRRR